MKKNLFTGVCTAIVTPFLNNEVNYPMLERLLQRQIEAGIPAVVLGGTTGEAPTLSDAEKETVKKEAVKKEAVKKETVKKEEAQTLYEIIEG